MAKKIIRFRLSHLEQLLAVAKEEDLLDDSQCRQVEAFDVFHDAGLFRKALSWLREYQTDLPEEGLHFKVYESPEEFKVRRLVGNSPSSPPNNDRRPCSFRRGRSDVFRRGLAPFTRIDW